MSNPEPNQQENQSLFNNMNTHSNNEYTGNATAQMQSGNATNNLRINKDRETGDWMLNKEISAELFVQWGQPKIDLFASKRNKQAEFFYRNPLDKSKPTSGCLGNDAFAAKWHSEELLYANPPWDLTEKLIAKLKKERDHNFSKLLQTIARP